MTETLFLGGLLFDGLNEAIEGQGVLVADGAVKAVAPAASFEGYAGSVIDTAGATLMPGLIDCHVHLCMAGEGDPGTALDKLLPGQVTMRAFSHAQKALAGGITAVRDCGGRDYLEFAVRDACNNGTQFGPTVRAAGRMICMTGGHGNRNGRVADGIEEVVKAVREQIHAGSDFVKIMATGGVMTPGVNPEDAHYSPEEMAAGIREANRFHRRTASHAQGTEGVLNAVRGGIDSVEHGIWLTDEAIREMIEADVWLVPTLAALRNIQDNAEKVPPYVIEKTSRIESAHRASVAAYHQAGGKIAMGTDAGTPFNLHGENAQELEYLVDVGVDPLTALRAGTSVAADLLDLPAQGRIVEGSAADLLVVDGNPFEDITRAARAANHRMVMKAGRIVTGDDIAAQAPLFQKAAAF